MQDDDRERKGKGPGGDERRGGGPPGAAFVDLEMSRVLYGEAEGLARDAVRDILRETLRARLRERLGARLDAVALLAADALADQVEANLGIERVIREQGERSRDIEERLRAAFASDAAGKTPRSPRPRRARRS